MITILSPAKSLDFTSKPATRVFTQPRLVAESSHLIDALRQLSVSEVAGLMRISDELAALNVQRYADFYFQHMMLEEKQVLPLAERVLTGEDWAALDAAFAANRDPLTGHKPEDDYRALFSRIVNALPAPLGLGEAR